jgi:hypothetical protein
MSGGMQLRPTIVSTLAVLLLASTGLVPGQETDNPYHKPVRSLTVVDANNKAVGDVFSTDFQIHGFTRSDRVPAVAFEYGGHTLVVGAVRDRLIGQDGSLFFETPDCTGNAYLEFEGGSPFPAVIPQNFVKHDGTLLIVDPTVAPTPVTINIQSILENNFNPPGPDLCTFNPQEGQTAIQATPLVNLNQLFQAPFRLQGQ